MGDNFYLGDRDGVRTPMQWSPDRNAGFSDTNPQKLYLPVILDPQYHYETVNVETQRANTSSLFWFMKRMINMRKKYKAFSRGDMKFIPVDNPKILAFTRTYDDESLLIVVNLSKYSQPAEIDIKEFNGFIPTETFSKNSFPVIKDNGPYFFTMSPYAYHWFVLRQPVTQVSSEIKYARIEVENWDALFTGKAVEELQNTILPDYIYRMPWFTSKGKTIYSTIIVEHTSLPVADAEVEILLIEVAFETGLPEYYNLPVAFVKKEEETKLAASASTAVMAQLTLGKKEGFLVDALYTTSFQESLFRFLANGKRFMSGGEVVFTSEAGLLERYKTAPHFTTRVFATTEMHTAITYDNQFLLKIYRKVDKGVHPDVEITRYLTGTDAYVSKYAGTIEWQLQDSVFILAMLEKQEENHGNGHQYMLERLANYMERILARNRPVIAAYPKKGTLTKPVSFEELEFELKEFVGGNAAEMARLAGKRLAEVHKALAANMEKEFLPEEFSLHYQRSLFSGMSSVVREMGQAIEKNIDNLPPEITEDVKVLGNKKQQLLTTLRRVYTKKFDVLKIRIHGNFGLSHILLTGRDIVLHDFGGNPLKPYSERRLKRSPLRDVSAMIRSFYYVAYEEFLSSSQVQQGEQNSLLSFADFWVHYMSGFFMRAYLDEIKGSGFIPEDQADFEVLIQTYLLENALHWFNYEVAHRPQRAVIPLRIIQTIIE
jgi:maltose alpha-D-glucosyltransferase/alpha-amylase